MLSGEGNAGERWKTAIGLISKKKQLCTCCSLFLHISLPLFCTTTTWNFRKLLSCTFYGGNVVRVLVHFSFFIATHYHLALVAATFSYFVTAAKKFQQKNVSFVFFPRSRSLSPFFSLSFAGLQPDFLFFSVFLLLYTPNLWTCWTMNVSWILWTTRIQKQFPFTVSSLLTLSLLYKTPVAMRFSAKITSSCIWVAIPVDWVILHWYACGADGRSGGRAVGVRSRDYQIFSDG